MIPEIQIQMGPHVYLGKCDKSLTVLSIEGRESTAMICDSSIDRPQNIQSRQLVVPPPLVIGWRLSCMGRMRGNLDCKPHRIPAPELAEQNLSCTCWSTEVHRESA